MKKSLRSLLAFLIAAAVLCCIAMAATGPKPSASFSFTGMPDEDYYVTMLSRVDTYGPHRVHQPGDEILGYVLEQGEYRFFVGTDNNNAVAFISEDGAVVRK